MSAKNLRRALAISSNEDSCNDNGGPLSCSVSHDWNGFVLNFVFRMVLGGIRLACRYSISSLLAFAKRDSAILQLQLRGTLNVNSLTTRRHCAQSFTSQNVRSILRYYMSVPWFSQFYLSPILDTCHQLVLRSPARSYFQTFHTFVGTWSWACL